MSKLTLFILVTFVSLAYGNGRSENLPTDATVGSRSQVISSTEVAAPAKKRSPPLTDLDKAYRLANAHLEAVENLKRALVEVGVDVAANEPITLWPESALKTQLPKYHLRLKECFLAGCPRSTKELRALEKDLLAKTERLYKIRDSLYPISRDEKEFVRKTIEELNGRTADHAGLAKKLAAKTSLFRPARSSAAAALVIAAPVIGAGAATQLQLSGSAEIEAAP